MRSYSVAEAKDHFQEILDRVRSGETVVVTEGGRPLAEVTPTATRGSEAKRQSDDDLDKIRQHFKNVTLEDMMSARHEGHKY